MTNVQIQMSNGGKNNHRDAEEAKGTAHREKQTEISLFPATTGFPFSRE